MRALSKRPTLSPSTVTVPPFKPASLPEASSVPETLVTPELPPSR